MEMEKSQRRIRQIAARTGLGLKFISKDMYLSDLLKKLEPLLEEHFILKGGTAISRAGYLSTPRFSEDVDLDIFTMSDKRDTSKDFHLVLQAIDGFTIEKPRVSRHLIRYDAYFNNHFEEKDRIRIEVSFQEEDRVPSKNANRTLLQSQFTSGQACLINTYTKVALFLRKINALSSRREGKDIFDLRGMWVAGLSKNEVMEGVKDFIGEDRVGGVELVSRAIENLGKMKSDQRAIAKAANHFIPRSERPDWGIIMQELLTDLEQLEARLNEARS